LVIVPLPLFFLVVSVILILKRLTHLFVEPIKVNIRFVAFAMEKFFPKLPTEIVIRSFVKVQFSDVIQITENLRRESHAKLFHCGVDFAFFDSVILGFLVVACKTLPRKNSF